MSARSDWLEANDRYLADGLARLRTVLSTAVSRPQPVQSSPPGVIEVEEPAEGTQLAISLDETAAGDVHVPALELLAERLDLTPFERDILLLCIGMEMDTRWPSLCADAQHDPTKPFPTFGLAFAALEDPSWDAMSPQRPLRYWQLVDIHQPGAQPMIGAALMADERIVNFAKGMNYLDPRVAPLVTVLPSVALPASQQDVARSLAATLGQVPHGQPLPVVQLLGSDSASKRAVARAVADLMQAQALELSSDLIPAGIAEQEELQRLWQRENQLLSIALLVVASDTPDGQGTPRLRRFLARAGGLTLVDVREPLASLGVDTIAVDVDKPTASEQRAAWKGVLGDGSDDHAKQLAGHFDFDTGSIQRIAQAALGAVAKASPASSAAPGSGAGDQAGAPELVAALWQGAIDRTRPALEGLAQRIDPKAGWEDLKLPDAEKNLLQQIADQVAHRGTVYEDWGFRDRMNRGLAITALFAGESGTGKTMAAEVLANHLKLPLYRIDLSAVVSKYIGETEKNLAHLFDAAEQGGAILFFDEADALFGRRSEVKDSHDRYANIEVNYLLQRLESFKGLAILVTNMKGALDGAFLRRIRFVVNFPFPGVGERQAIWSSVFPQQAATGALDVARLAKLALSGGSIQGIALNAAFMAARAGVQVGMPLLLQAAREEFRKLDKPVNEADFHVQGSGATS
jgi:nucleotide-binding universal stress UspA family protein